MAKALIIDNLAALSKRREVLIINELIKILVYADTEENALDEAENIALELCITDGAYYFLIFSNFGEWPEKISHFWKDLPVVLPVSTAKFPTEDKRGLDIVMETMECIKADFISDLQDIRYNLGKYSDEDIFDNEGEIDELVEVNGRWVCDGPEALRGLCQTVGASRGVPAKLYDPYRWGIWSKDHLLKILDHRDGTECKPLWLVPVIMEC